LHNLRFDRRDTRRQLLEDFHPVFEPLHTSSRDSCAIVCSLTARKQ
jgi:hypothetical protein